MRRKTTNCSDGAVSGPYQLHGFTSPWASSTGYQANLYWSTSTPSVDFLQSRFSGKVLTTSTNPSPVNKFVLGIPAGTHLQTLPAQERHTLVPGVGLGRMEFGVIKRCRSRGGGVFLDRKIELELW